MAHKFHIRRTFPAPARDFAACALLLLFALVRIGHAAEDGAAKYVFLFIGDGMGAAQRNAAELYLAGMREANGDDAPRDAQLVMNNLPVSGTIRTNSLSGVTDSAAAGTALTTGHKTVNGALAMHPDTGERYESIAKIAKARGKRVGIVSTAFIQDATPAAFYAQATKRTQHYAIGKQLAASGFDYFAGGGFRNPTDRDKSKKHLLEVAAEAGYRVVRDAAGFRALPPGDGRKTLVVHPDLVGADVPFAVDGAKSGIALADLVAKGIELLDGEGGFFMMVEGARIDVACHANDAAAAIRETLAFDEAIAVAVAFCEARPEETLIVVTSDHETGGMRIAAKPEERTRFYRLLSAQKGSYAKFERTVAPQKNAGFDDFLKRARAYFGPDLPDTPAVRQAFAQSMTPKKERPTKDKDYKKRYGPYDPVTMACIRETNRLAGVTWTTFYHTGSDIPVSALGAGAETFAGLYENTEIPAKILRAMR